VFQCCSVDAPCVVSLAAVVFVLASPLHWRIDCSKDVGLEVKAQKTKCMFKSGLM